VNPTTDLPADQPADLSDKASGHGCGNALLKETLATPLASRCSRQPDRPAIALVAGLAGLPPADRPGLGLASHSLSGRIG